MPFVELFTRRGSLSERQRSHISEKLVAEVMRAEGAPDTEAARSISWLLVHDVDTWVIGGEPVGEDEPARFVWRLGVPAGWRKDPKRHDRVARITRTLAEIDDDPERLYGEPAAWVHINEIPEGNWGAPGRVVGLAGIAEFVSTGALPAASAAIQG